MWNHVYDVFPYLGRYPGKEIYDTIGAIDDGVSFQEIEKNCS